MTIDRRALLRELARDPILAELGLVDAHRLRTAVEKSCSPETWKESNQGDLLTTLTLEAWLQVRAGRWPRGFAMPREH